ncbi:MAG: 3-phosphoshikimate 1-carboxyvinyltransferase [Nitrospirae bacterium]|nr:MAG: 3-phosphoshikimate 1-carboxyvinyltransferase [Nitrospirota bacterium]
MNNVQLVQSKGLRGEITPPPDKSISHRAIMFSALAGGISRVKNFLRAEDPISTMNVFRRLGVKIDDNGDELIIEGKGLTGLSEPFDVLDCGNSGTTMRLISGILAGNPFFSVLTGDDSLKQRPMARVIGPLRLMGADISGRSGDKYPPLAIKGRKLNSIKYKMPVASAQVKSCVMLAGLYAEGITEIIETFKSRDHTERMLKAMGANIEVEGLSVKVASSELNAADVIVPGDFSSAAFFIAAALMLPDSEIMIKNVGMNPTRTGFLDVVKKMGAVVSVENEREVSGEPVADLFCKSCDTLKSVSIGADLMPSLIDEFPILCVLATQAEGITEIRGAEELRVKESDRIKTVAEELRKFGVDLEEFPDGMAVKGRAALKGCSVESHHDHRIAMSMAVAALAAEGKTIINNASCADISFPGFFERLGLLAR